MQDILAQLIPAGPGDDAEGWMNILFVVVLAVFWVISGVIKATSKRPQDRQKQQASRKPIREVPRSTTPRDPSSARPTRKAQDRPQMRPRPVSQAAQLEKAYRSGTVDASRTLESSQTNSQVEPLLEDLPEFTSKPLVELGQMRLDLPRRTTEAEEELPDLIMDFTDPDELSKAILHYEILGPPVSLRNPSDQMTGF